MSNNVAEYYALIELVKWYKENRLAVPLKVYSDSQLVVNQMNGVWAVRGGLYLPYYNRLLDMLDAATYQNLTFEWIPGEENLADELAKSILRQHGVRVIERKREKKGEKLRLSED